MNSMGLAFLCLQACCPCFSFCVGLAASACSDVVEVQLSVLCQLLSLELSTQLTSAEAATSPLFLPPCLPNAPSVQLGQRSAALSAASSPSAPRSTRCWYVPSLEGRKRELTCSQPPALAQPQVPLRQAPRHVRPTSSHPPRIRPKRPRPSQFDPLPPSSPTSLTSPHLPRRNRSHPPRMEIPPHPSQHRPSPNIRRAQAPHHSLSRPSRSPLDSHRSPQRRERFLPLPTQVHLEPSYPRPLREEEPRRNPIGITRVRTRHLRPTRRAVGRGRVRVRS